MRSRPDEMLNLSRREGVVLACGVDPERVVFLAEHEADPKTYEAPLAKKLAEASAGDDVALVAAAKALMELVDQKGAKAGKYNVVIKDSKGVQVGDGNIQINKL